MTSGRDLFAPKPGLTVPLCGLHFVFFFLQVADPNKTAMLFAFWPDAALARPWGFVTYQFLHGGPLGLFFGALMLYILGAALEAEWGTKAFTVFWLVATLGGSLSAWALGTRLVGDPFVVPISMLFAFAYLFPDVQFFMFFVVPVKVKWLAWIAAALLLLGFFRDLLGAGVGTALVRIIGSSAGFAFVWIRERGRFHARKAAREAVSAVKSAGAVHEDAALARRNRELFPKVEALRAATSADGPLPPDLEAFEMDLRKLVVPGVNICKPVDFKGDKDGICVKCEGFAECSLRYVAGQPPEILVRQRD